MGRIWSKDLYPVSSEDSHSWGHRKVYYCWRSIIHSFQRFHQRVIHRTSRELTGKKHFPSILFARILFHRKVALETLRHFPHKLYPSGSPLFRDCFRCDHIVPSICNSEHFTFTAKTFSNHLITLTAIHLRNASAWDYQWKLSCFYGTSHTRRSAPDPSASFDLLDI